MTDLVPPVDASADDVASYLIGLFDSAGHQRYDEAVTQTEHAVQAAELAARAGADGSLIVAALLHDVGHLLERRGDGTHAREHDLRHEHIAARLLARWFGPEVVDPIRFHVDAKRYLCAVDPAYHATLSPASVRSLELQGGPMTSTEVAFAGERPGFADGVELRRWDDLAKDPDLSVTPIGAYHGLVARSVERARSSSTVRLVASGGSRSVHPDDLDTRP